MTLTATAPARGAEAQLDVSGSVRAVEGGDLAVEVTLTNASAVATSAINAEAQLLDRRRHATLKEGLPAGSSGVMSFPFPLEFPQPGVYPVMLHLEYSAAGPSSPPLSQRAFLLVALGGQADPSVRISLDPLRLSTFGKLRVTLESTDARPHRVRLRTETPRGLRALDAGAGVEVPAQGKRPLQVGLLRTGTSHGPQGVLVIAESEEGGLHRTTVATGTVELRPDQPWLPRLRLALLGLAGLLLATSAFVEVRRRQRGQG